MKLVERQVAEEEARRLYQRTLGSWASDLLRLRAKGLDRPGYRRAVGGRIVSATFARERRKAA